MACCAAIEYPPPAHEDAAVDVAGMVVAIVAGALGSQLEASPSDYQAGHTVALAPRGFSGVLEAEIARAGADAATAPGTKTIALLQRMARENPLWVPERIRGELLNLTGQLTR